MAEGILKNQEARRLSSPEQLNDYLRVTTPRVWILLAAVVLLAVGLLVWSNVAVIESYATGTATVSNGELVVVFDDAKQASQVQAGMTLEVGDAEAEILTVGTDKDGNVVASSQAKIPDGVYDARVGYRATQVIKILLN